MPRPRKPTTLAMEVMKAGEHAQKAARRVASAETALSKARTAQEKADAEYLDLVRRVVAAAPAAKEGAPQIAA